MLAVYAFGYSAILFGLIMLVSLTGERYMDVYGCKIPKIVLPFGYLVFSQMIVANADWMGHLSGIIAALIVKYLGVYPIRLLPQFAWLLSIEDDCTEQAKRWHKLLGYFCATEEIEKDFACKLNCGPCRKKSEGDQLRDARLTRLRTAEAALSRSMATDSSRSSELRTMQIESESTQP